MAGMILAGLLPMWPAVAQMAAPATFETRDSAVPAQVGLLDAYAMAVLNDPSLRAAQATRSAGQEGIAIGRAALLPQVSLSYQNMPRNRQNVRYATADGQSAELDRDYSSYAGTLTLSQALLDKAAWERWKQAGAVALMADEQLRDQSQHLARRVLKAYTDVLHAREQVDLAGAQRDAYAEQLRRNREAFAHGDGTRTDIAETEARLYQAQVQLISARDEADAAVQALRNVTGLPEDDLQVLQPLRADFVQRVAPGLQTAPYGEWETLALARNADLLARRYALEGTRREVQGAKAGHWPTVRLIAQHERNKSDIAASYNQRYHTNSIGVQLSIPLYAGGGISATARQAAFRLQNEQATLDAKVDEVMLELQRQYRLSDSGPARIEAGQAAVRAAQAAMEGTRAGVAAGDRINADLLDAMRELYQARTELSRTIYDTLNARLALRYRAGVLNEEDLREMAAYFELSMNLGQVQNKGEEPPL